MIYAIQLCSTKKRNKMKTFTCYHLKDLPRCQVMPCNKLAKLAHWVYTNEFILPRLNETEETKRKEKRRKSAIKRTTDTTTTAMLAVIKEDGNMKEEEIIATGCRKTSSTTVIFEIFAIVITASDSQY